MRTFFGRWLFLVLGGALFTPYAFLAMMVVPLAIPSLTEAGNVTLAVVATLVLVTTLVATSLLPVVRTLEAAVVPSLIGGAARDLDIPAGPLPRGAAARGTAWYLLHTVLGAVVSVVSVVALPVALALLAGTVLGDPAIPFGREGVPVARAWSAPLALALLVGLAALVALAGAALAGLAPRLLGPGPATRLQVLERRTAELTERTRLARELHDSIGHALTVTTLQAGAARTVLHTDPAFAEQALLAIEQTGRAAAADLDGFLGLLRDEPSPRAPQPSLRDLDALVATHREAGLPLDVEVTGDLSQVPAVVSREVYRIAQEALTNVHRHARDAATQVHLSAGPDVLVLSVVNQAPARRPGPSGRRGGRGLAGVRERLALLGGRLETGACEGGGWSLRATVPTRPQA